MTTINIHKNHTFTSQGPKGDKAILKPHFSIGLDIGSDQGDFITWFCLICKKHFMEEKKAYKHFERCRK